MSFLRVGHHGQRKKKVISKKKPNWDDSLSDLSVYKPTQQELAMRHAAHKSKNHMSVKLEKMRKAKQKNASLSNAEARQVAIMKEVLYDQKQLHDTLSKSDKMMAVVKDLFGDDPRRFMGFPNVTNVPNGEEQPSKNGSIVAPVPDIRTRTETLSDSVMKQAALNDLLDSESDDEVDEVEPIVYQPQMNLKRFQQFLAAEEERNQTLSTITGHAQLSQTEGGPIQSTRLQLSQEETGYETPRKEHNESIEMLRTPRSAINDTKKVKKTKKRVSPQKENCPQNTSALNLTDLRKVLGNLENEIEQYEKQTGRRPPAEKQRSETFSGYTVALVDSVSKLATYLRETDLRLQAEMTVREQLTQDVYQLRNIVDTLTSDIIVTQEEYSSVVTEFQRYRAETREEIDRLKKAVYRGQQISRSEQINTSHRDHRLPQPQPTKESYPPAPGIPGEVDASYSALPDHVSSHAVVLSPPVRKTRVTEEQDQQQQQPTQSKRQTSLIDITTLAESHSHSLPPSNQPPRSGPPPQQVATVSVPRPTPLVQSNLPGGGLSSTGHPQTGYSARPVSVPVQNDLPVSEQIAELNRQHEEAQKRLQLLFQQQEKQHMQMVIQQQQKYQQHEQQQKYQHPQQQQMYPQQQRLEESYPPQEQLYQPPAQSKQPVHNQQYGSSRPVTNTARPILEQGVHGMDSRDVSLPGYHQHPSPPRVEHQQVPVSPPISPISTRSENFSVLQHLQNRQRQYGGTGREITVNLPVMDLETSAGSLPSPKTISPAH